MRISIRRHPVLLSAVMALAVAVLFNICFMLFFAYGDYVISNQNTEQVAMPPHGGHGPAMREHHPEGKLPMKPGEPRMTEREHSFPLMMIAGNIFIHFVATFVIFLICFSILFKSKAAQWKKITMNIAACVVWILLFGYLSAQFMGPDEPGGPGRVHFMQAMTTISLFLGMIVLLSSLLIYYINKGLEAEIENESLRALNYSTQYEALKSKLDPHFLFNALNTLSGLIAINSDHCEDYIQKLSSIFRTTLNHNDITTLADEVAFAKAYGDLMTIRYDESLIIQYDIPEELEGRTIVTFSIQTLLENVIKHNTITNRLPMEINISADDAYVTVSNPIHPKRESEPGNGLGLKLLSQRCQALLSKDIVIDDQQSTFIVKIPIK